MASDATTWSGSLHLSFRLLPEGRRSPSLEKYLAADGKSDAQVLASLPYDKARSKSPGAGPDPRRYRDGRQLYTMLGFLYEEDKTVHVTLLGRTVLEWLEFLTEQNAPTLGLYAVRSLAAYQLRNPTVWGQKYDPTVEAFPFAFIWRAMLALEDRISSEELNRAMFRVINEASLSQAIQDIAASRDQDDVKVMGAPVLTGTAVNDRLIPWISMASFGYTLITDKDSDGYYRIRPEARSTLARAAAVRLEHKSFATVRKYVSYLSSMTGLPETHSLNDNLPAVNKPPTQASAP